MKLIQLKDILKTPVGSFQSTIVYDSETHKFLVYGCSVEYAIAHYGDKEIKHIGTLENQLILYI